MTLGLNDNKRVPSRGHGRSANPLSRSRSLLPALRQRKAAGGPQSGGSLHSQAASQPPLAWRWAQGHGATPSLPLQEALHAPARRHTV